MFLPLSAIILSALLIILLVGRITTDAFADAFYLERCLRQEVIDAYHKESQVIFLVLVAVIIILSGYVLYVVSPLGVENGTALLFPDKPPFGFGIWGITILGSVCLVFLSVIICKKNIAFFKKLSWVIGVQRSCKMITGTILSIRVEEEGKGSYLTIRDENGVRKELYLDQDDTEDFCLSKLGTVSVLAFYDNRPEGASRIIMLLAQ